MSVNVATIERAVANRFSVERAEEWDRVGLLAGDPEAVVTGIVLALDPTPEVLAEARKLGANVVVTHHPAFLSAPRRLTPGGADVVFDAVSTGIALINAHTNLDRDEQAQRLIPELLGLDPLRPLEVGLQPMTLVTVWVPQASEASVVAAMTGAGAGRVGDYTGCSFSGEGIGRFTPGPLSSPRIGEVGVPSETGERRIEMVCPRAIAGAVVAAAHDAHPYEEPLIAVQDAAIARNAAALGMLSAAPAGTTVGALAGAVARAFGVTVRVWGPADAPVERVATATGSGGSLIGAATTSGAQVLVAGEVRYHDALSASSAGLSVIEAGHDVTEWPLVRLLAECVRAVPGIDTVPVHEMPARPGWWSLREDDATNG